MSTKEPFQKLVSQGMILGEVEYTAFKNAAGESTAESADTAAVLAGGGYA